MYIYIYILFFPSHLDQLGGEEGGRRSTEQGLMAHAFIHSPAVYRGAVTSHKLSAFPGAGGTGRGRGQSGPSSPFWAEGGTRPEAKKSPVSLQVKMVNGVTCPGRWDMQGSGTLMQCLLPRAPRSPLMGITSTQGQSLKSRSAQGRLPVAALGWAGGGGSLSPSALPTSGELPRIRAAPWLVAAPTPACASTWPSLPCLSMSAPTLHPSLCVFSLLIRTPVTGCGGHPWCPV